MARVKFGDGVSGQTGSLNKAAGGVTYLKNNVKRMRVIPTNPQTASQGETRGTFSFLTVAWANLSEDQRAAWETARTGNAYYSKQDNFYGVSRPFNSGKSLFIAMNFNALLRTNALNAPEVLINTPATSPGIDTYSITSFNFDASSGTAALTFVGTSTNETLAVLASPPVSPGNLRLTSVKSKMRVITGDTGPSPAALGDEYVAKFGAITGSTGQKVFWTVNAIDNATGKSRFIATGQSVIVA